MNASNEKTKILLLPLTGTHGASSRYRVHQYVPFLEEAGFQIKTWPAVGNNIYERRTNKPTAINKLIWLLARALRRIAALFFVRKYDVIFLQRETMPFGFPIIDLAICRLASRVVFDFDDAIYTAAEKHSGLIFKLADPRRAERIFECCDVVIAANQTLAAYARQSANKVVVIPTALDFAKYRSAAGNKSDLPTIGWIGSPFTAFYLKNLFPVFSNLTKKFTFEVKCIGADFSEQVDFHLTCQPWASEREIADIKSFDIGIMPLTDNEWSKGKSGLKLLQYLAAGVAAVASPVGVNKEIISHEQNGLFANKIEEWEYSLAKLLADEAFRCKLADSAKQTFPEKFNVKVTAGQLIQVFESL
ncbi:MAG: glycosyltransferase family 4 protein [bacterium]